MPQMVAVSRRIRLFLVVFALVFSIVVFIFRSLYFTLIRTVFYISQRSPQLHPAAIGPYSQGIVLGNIFFASGQIPIDPATGEIHGTTIEEQAEQVMKNIGELLKAAGTDYTRVAKTSCFLADMGDFAAFNQVYAKYFTENPARSCVAVKTLPKNVLCEVEVIAEV